MSDIQVRGNCQICGRVHAYNRGFVAAHGYTIQHGWFEGVCAGQNFKPMQLDRSETDKCCASIRFQCVALVAKAVAVEAGEFDPPAIKSTIPGREPTPFRLAAPWQQQEVIKSFAWSLRRRAEIGESVARDLEGLATRVHGTPLVEVKREKAADPIRIGERRQSGHMVLVCTRVDGPRVYWKATGPNGRSVTGWTGSGAWRRHPFE